MTYSLKLLERARSISDCVSIVAGSAKIVAEMISRRRTRRYLNCRHGTIPANHRHADRFPGRTWLPIRLAGKELESPDFGPRTSNLRDAGLPFAEELRPGTSGANGQPEKTELYRSAESATLSKAEFFSTLFR
jgi:hypothetical protein